MFLLRMCHDSRVVVNQQFICDLHHSSAPALQGMTEGCVMRLQNFQLYIWVLLWYTLIEGLLVVQHLHGAATMYLLFSFGLALFLPR